MNITETTFQQKYPNVYNLLQIMTEGQHPIVLKESRPSFAANQDPVVLNNFLIIENLKQFIHFADEKLDIDLIEDLHLNDYIVFRKQLDAQIVRYITQNYIRQNQQIDLSDFGLKLNQQFLQE